LQVSLVGGEPLVRKRELNEILPALSEMGVYTMVVTSAVIPIPAEWMRIPRALIAVSVDGLREHHDDRRKPATYERVLKNIAGRKVNIHWTITRPMLSRPGYLEEYLAFWNARPEVSRIWTSVYTPQMDENSPEMLTEEERRQLVNQLLPLRREFRKFLFSEGIADALLDPPSNPNECLFSKMSANYSADLETHVEPCVFGGTPDCSHCGCAISTGLHWLQDVNVVGPIKIGHIVRGSIGVGSLINRLSSQAPPPKRWENRTLSNKSKPALVQIG